MHNTISEVVNSHPDQICSLNRAFVVSYMSGQTYCKMLKFGESRLIAHVFSNILAGQSKNLGILWAPAVS